MSRLSHEQLRAMIEAGVDQLERGGYVEYDITERERFLADIRRRAASGRALTRPTTPAPPES
jgi:hypothetical protein